MVSPVTGPFSDQQGINVDRAGSLRIQRTWYRQRKPFNLPLIHRRVVTATLEASWSGVITSPGGFANAWTGKSPWQLYAYPADWNTPEVMEAANKALEKFRGEMTSSAQWLVNLAERQQALDMIEGRALQILQFVKRLKHGDLVGAGRSLAVPPSKVPVPKRNAKAKSLGNQFLEWHFGWEPLIQDIHESCELLSQPIKNHFVRVKSKVPVEWYWFQDLGSGSFRRASHKGKAGVGIQASVAVSNPNLFLASQLGLINPASVVWELVPWSFVLDWFANVGQFLDSFTALAGASLVDPMSTLRFIDTCSAYTESHYIAPPNLWAGALSVDSYCVTRDRKLGLPDVSLKWRSPWRLSKIRAATAVSLLLQQLPRR